MCLPLDKDTISTCRLEKCFGVKSRFVSLREIELVEDFAKYQSWQWQIQFCFTV